MCFYVVYTHLHPFSFNLQIVNNLHLIQTVRNVLMKKMTMLALNHIHLTYSKTHGFLEIL